MFPLYSMMYHSTWYKLNWNAPENRWRWKKVSEVAELLPGKGISAMQIGRVLSKLNRVDSRVKLKNKNNVKEYFLPSMNRMMPYHAEEDFDKALES